MDYCMVIAGIIIVALGIIVSWALAGASSKEALKNNIKDAFRFLIIVVIPVAIGIVICAFGFQLIENGLL